MLTTTRAFSGMSVKDVPETVAFWRRIGLTVDDGPIALTVVLDFAEAKCAAVAELPGPHAKLMSRVHRRIRHRLRGPVTGGVAGEELGEGRVLGRMGIETEQRGGIRGKTDHVWLAERLRR